MSNQPNSEARICPECGHNESAFDAALGECRFMIPMPYQARDGWCGHKCDFTSDSQSSGTPPDKASQESIQSEPMSRADYLLSHLAQECCEIAIRCTKAQMFGLDEIQPGQEFTNRERIIHEICDMMAVGELLKDENIIPNETMDGGEVGKRIEAKRTKANHFSDYSRQLGRLAPRELDSP